MSFYLRYFSVFILLIASRSVVAADEEIYKVGGDVKAPVVVHYVEPDTSDQDNYMEGVVKLEAVVNLDGTPSDLRVVKGLNESEDKVATEALKQWRFKPGTKSGQPVRVRINVEIAFHLL